MKPPLRMATIAITTAMVGSVSVLLVRPLFLRMEEVAVAEVRPDSWRYPNEQSWMVGETLGHVAGLAHFARTGTVAPSQSIDFAVRDRAGADGRRNVFEVSRRDGTGEHEELRAWRV